MSRYYYRNRNPNNVKPFFFVVIALSLLVSQVTQYPQFLGIALLGVLLIIAAWAIKKRKAELSENETEEIIEENTYSVYKAKNQITETERAFYEVLKNANQDKYDIQRQVVLSSIIDVTSKNYVDYKNRREFNPDRSRIDKKTLDFVLFDKTTLMPYMAIELDDPSHLKQNRVERDHFVEPLLKAVGIPLLRIKTAYSYNPVEISELINQNTCVVRNK
jgi:very-short-patch-repair endonuclease